MTSRGIGDARRVRGDQQTWLQQNFPGPTTRLPDHDGDPVIDFVCVHLIETESDVAIEARDSHDVNVPGVVVFRYAHDIRRQCSAIRLVLPVRQSEGRQRPRPTLDPGRRPRPGHRLEHPPLA